MCFFSKNSRLLSFGSEVLEFSYRMDRMSNCQTNLVPALVCIHVPAVGARCATALRLYERVVPMYNHLCLDRIPKDLRHLRLRRRRQQQQQHQQRWPRGKATCGNIGANANHPQSARKPKASSKPRRRHRSKAVKQTAETAAAAVAAAAAEAMDVEASTMPTSNGFVLAFIYCFMRRFLTIVGLKKSCADL